MLAWHDLVGAIGVALIVVTYSLLQFNKLDSDKLAYSVLNALGAALVLASLVMNFNLAAFIIEVFWLLISALGILKYYVRTRHPSQLPTSLNN